jgi:hypothetical protein
MMASMETDYLCDRANDTSVRLVVSSAAKAEQQAAMVSS